MLKVGFAAAATHDIIPIDRCPILDPALDGALDAAWALAEPLISSGKPLDIQITATDNGLDVDIRGSGPLKPAMVATLSRVAEKHRLARLTRHGEMVLMRSAADAENGAAACPCRRARSCRRPSPARRRWARWCRTHCGRAKYIADLFCGVGPFALRLAARARIAAFDSDAAAVASLQKAATTRPG